jgi:hypothetical protein
VTYFGFVGVGFGRASRPTSEDGVPVLYDNAGFALPRGPIQSRSPAP